MNVDNNFERLPDGSNEVTPYEIQDDDMPSPEDLGDLFNFEFNKSNSYSQRYDPNASTVNDYNKKQSIFLFITKFESIDGLIKKLNSSANGLKEGDVDLENRREKYGRNEFDHRQIKSIMARCMESANDNMLKILFFGSIVSIVIGLYNQSKDSN